MKSSVIFITGAAGFIGSSLVKYLLQKNLTVIGVDNFFPNYDVQYKKANVSSLTSRNFHFYETDILNSPQLEQIYSKHRPDTVIHLAGLTGVRASIKKPQSYQKVNVTGTKNIYEISAKYKVTSFIFASSSSVYGDSTQIPFAENQPLKPKSPYAASKLAAEKLLKILHQKYQLSTTVLRFFSVYGPYGRPDMAPYLFTEAAFNQTPIVQFGDGTAARDYTYVDDVITAIYKTINKKFLWEIINIGNSYPVPLLELIKLIETETHAQLQIRKQPLNSYETKITYADISKAKNLLKWEPQTTFTQGLHLFVNWYKKNRL